jgi:hypothetical protein
MNMSYVVISSGTYRPRGTSCVITLHVHFSELDQCEIITMVAVAHLNVDMLIGNVQ